MDADNDLMIRHRSPTAVLPAARDHGRARPRDGLFTFGLAIFRRRLLREG
jgi:hypothetical protein